MRGPPLLLMLLISTLIFGVSETGEALYVIRRQLLEELAQMVCSRVGNASILIVTAVIFASY